MWGEATCIVDGAGDGRFVCGVGTAGDGEGWGIGDGE